ncbi:hypothetical protein [Micromonospora echinaurantiaca]
MRQDDGLSDGLQLGANLALAVLLILAPIACCAGLVANWSWH